MATLTEPATEMVELRALQPFCGRYRVPLNTPGSELSEVLIDPDGTGFLKKLIISVQPFLGVVGHRRSLTESEERLADAGKLPSNFEVDPLPPLPVDGRPRPRREVMVHADPATCRVPADVAADLVARGLAERVDTVPVTGLAASIRPA